MPILDLLLYCLVNVDTVKFFDVPLRMEKEKLNFQIQIIFIIQEVVYVFFLFLVLLVGLLQVVYVFAALVDTNR